MNAAFPVAAAALAGAVALARPAASARTPEPLVELEVAGVIPLEDAHAGVLVLKQKGRALVLPIVVGSGEADVVARRLRKEAPARPRANDLLDRAIVALGARVVRVEIRDAAEALYRGRVFLAQGSQRVELDARPSDSIAIALGARAPIFAPRALVDASGLTPEDLDRLRAGGSTGEHRGDDREPPEQRM